MKEQAKNILSAVYQNYLETDSQQYYFDLTKESDKRVAYDSITFLVACGYLEPITLSLKHCVVLITPSGIHFAENDFQDLCIQPSIQGNNITFVNGSNNTISDNYNLISSSISQADLPDETKELILSLIEELKNPHLSPEKKSDKIKAFLIEISAGVLSGTAVTGLTWLFAYLFSFLSK